MPVIDKAEIERRFLYHAPNENTRKLHDDVREVTLDYALFLLDALPESREKSLAFTALEEASYHAHAAIARNL